MNLGDWALTILGSLVIGSFAGVGTAMVWFRASKTRIYERLDRMDVLIKERLAAMQIDMDRRVDKTEIQLHDLSKADNAHAIQLSVLTTCQANIALTLAELKEDGREQNRKLDTLLQGQSHS